jgi:hypothetical protein
MENKVPTSPDDSPRVTKPEVRRMERPANLSFNRSAIVRGTRPVSNREPRR